MTEPVARRAASARVQNLPKQPPHSLEAEQAVLGGLLLNNKVWMDFADKLSPQDFYRADHQMLYTAICELIGTVMKRVGARIGMLRNNRNALAGMATGFVELDRRTHGLHGGDLVIIAARPGMGKTTLAMNIAEHVALVDKKPVAVFSME